MRNAYRVPAADYDTHSSKLIARSHDDYLMVEIDPNRYLSLTNALALKLISEDEASALREAYQA
jgi:pheromone shutdown protein TraB